MAINVSSENIDVIISNARVTIASDNIDVIVANPKTFVASENVDIIETEIGNNAKYLNQTIEIATLQAEEAYADLINQLKILYLGEHVLFPFLLFLINKYQLFYLILF